MSNRKLIALIGAILVLAAAACGAIPLLSKQNSRVVVTVNGAEYGRFDLHQEQTVRIEAEDGSWYNLLEISGGEAAIIESDCQNQVCVHTPPLTEETVGIIVCLPHGVTVELK